MEIPQPNQTRRISCPYFQRDPNKPHRPDSCYRRGFKAIDKMKEHLHRVHNHTTQCPRCYTLFRTDAALTTHLRATGPNLCQPSPSQPTTEGYTRAQSTALADRMRGQTSLQKWTAIWLILFPSDPPDAIPPPWWTPRQTPETSCTRYDSFLRTNLPTALCPRLETLVVTERCLEMGAQQHLRSAIDVIVRECVDQTLAAASSSSSSSSFEDGGSGGQGATAVMPPASSFSPPRPHMRLRVDSRELSPAWDGRLLIDGVGGWDGGMVEGEEEDAPVADGGGGGLLVSAAVDWSGEHGWRAADGCGEGVLGAGVGSLLPLFGDTGGHAAAFWGAELELGGGGFFYGRDGSGWGGLGGEESEGQ